MGQIMLELLSASQLNLLQAYIIVEYFTSLLNIFQPIEYFANQLNNLQPFGCFATFSMFYKPISGFAEISSSIYREIDTVVCNPSYH